MEFILFLQSQSCDFMLFWEYFSCSALVYIYFGRCCRYRKWISLWIRLLDCFRNLRYLHFLYRILLCCRNIRVKWILTRGTAYHWLITYVKLWFNIKAICHATLKSTLVSLDDISSSATSLIPCSINILVLSGNVNVYAILVNMWV